MVRKLHKKTISVIIPLIAFVALASNIAVVDSADSVEHGKNFDREILSVNPDGSTTYKFSTHSERILKNGDYLDYVFTDDWLTNSMRVETMGGSVALDKSSCVFNFYNSGFIGLFETPLFSDSITPYNSITDLFSWNEVTQISNASCETYWNGSELVAKKHAEGVGFIEYKFILINGVWKTQLEATNLTTLTNRVFAFDQTIDLNSDLISWGGDQKNLDNFDGHTFDRDFLENNETKLMNLTNGINYDLSLAFDYLDSVTVYDTGENKSRLVFHFMRNNEVLMPNETLIIDPTFSDNSAAWDNSALEEDDDGTCDDTGGSYSLVVNEAQTTLATGVRGSSSSKDCSRLALEFDTVSLPASIIVANTTLALYVDAVENVGSVTCEFYGMETQPSTRTAAQLFDEIDNTNTFLTADTDCTTTGQKNYDFGSVGNAYAQNFATANDYFAIGVKTNEPAQTANNQRTTWRMAEYGSTEPTLTIIYTMANLPDSITDLSLDSVTSTSATVSFTAPDLHGETLINYMLNNTTPQTNEVTVFNQNSSSTTIIISGLTSGTPYSAQVTAFTANGGNWTLANVVNYTTTTATPSDAVDDLVAVAPDFNIIFLNWTEPLLNNGNVSGYQILSDPTSPPSTVLIATTGNDTTQYYLSGLTDDTQYCFRLSAITEGGTNQTGNIVCLDTKDPAAPVKEWLDLMDADLNIDDAFGLEIGIAGIVMLFGVGLATKNVIYGAVLFGVILGFALYFEFIEISTTIVSTVIFFIILIIFSAKKPNLN